LIAKHLTLGNQGVHFQSVLLVQWERTRYTLGGALANDSSTPPVQIFLRTLRNPL